MQDVVFFKIIILLLFGVATKAVSLNEITASDGAFYDQFGYSVSISGTTAIVGAPNKNYHQGAAYIFTCATPANCTQASTLLASDGASMDYFGWSVSISGTTTIVGAPYAGIDENAEQGAAYIFSCSTPSNCTQASELIASDGASGDYFGYSVSISGTTAIVGANTKNIGSNSGQGAAYIFDCLVPANCTQALELVASDGASGDSFGYSVSISGTIAIVGAPYKTIGSNSGQGAAYIFTCAAPANCNQTLELVASNGTSRDYFGYSVSISGTTIIVGASGKNSSQGAAYIFSCPTPATCTQASELIASDGASNNQFGSSVSISGTTAIVGAYYKTIGSNYAQGAVYIFTCPTPSTCTQTSELLASDGALGDQFGHSVSISGTTAIVGAINAGNSSQGAAYVVNLLSTPTPTPTATSTSTPTSTPTPTPTPAPVYTETLYYTGSTCAGSPIFTGFSLGASCSPLACNAGSTTYSTVVSCPTSQPSPPTIPGTYFLEFSYSSSAANCTSPPISGYFFPANTGACFPIPVVLNYNSTKLVCSNNGVPTADVYADGACATNATSLSAGSCQASSGGYTNFECVTIATPTPTPTSPAPTTPGSTAAPTPTSVASMSAPVSILMTGSLVALLGGLI